MSVKGYRHSVDININNLIESVSDGFKEDILDEIEQDVKEARDVLKDVQDLTTDDFDSIIEAVNEAVDVLDKLADKLY